MTSGGTEQIDPDSLDRLASTIKSTVAPQVAAAKAAFEAAEVGGDAFSASGLSMAIVYPGTRQWAMADAQSKTDELTSVCDRLGETADYWRQAEQDSTVTWLGN